MTTQKATRELVLKKGSEKYIFRYDAGAEDKLLDALVDQASDKRTDFDWFDAAVISFKLAGKLINEADELIRKGSPKVGESFQAATGQ